MGLTVTVHDRLYNYAVVALFRTENTFRVPGFGLRNAPNAARRMWCRRQARLLAERLNAEEEADG